MWNNKAPKLDGIPAEVLKVVAKSHPNLLLCMFNACLVARVFPSRWKKSRLVLVGKGQSDLESPLPYRLLCMLNTPGNF